MSSVELLEHCRPVLLLQTRTDAPPVYLNPISNGIPGNVRGPDDLE